MRRTVQRAIDLLRSSRIDTGELRTICVLVGPYRNLTTITASVLALHPHCQVLNHAGSRILNARRLDFFRFPERTTFDAFARYAIWISRAGRRGDFGGSITLSHAFANSAELRELYRDAYGERRVKDVIHTVCWKESLAVTKHIRVHGVDLAELLHADPRLRFLLPIRNPLDCAASNLKTGHAARFSGLDAQASIEDVLLAILNEFHWFVLWRNRHPDRFFHYFAYEFGARVVCDMTRFLGLEADEPWCAKAASVFRKGEPYPHSGRLRDFYRSAVSNRFRRHPEFAAKLLQFLEPSAAAG